MPGEQKNIAMRETTDETTGETTWFLQHEGREIGPMSTTELCRLLGASALGPQSMVRPAAWDQARPASMFPELELAATTKPKVPPTPLTAGIVAINAAIFVAMVVSGTHILSPDSASLIRWGANFGPKTLDGEWWRLLTSVFIHIGAIHILFNMSVLWDVGRFMERQIGSVRLAVIYLFSGLLASLASLAWNSFIVSAGASGAVFGVYGSLVALLLRVRGVPDAALHSLRRSALTFLVFNLAFGLVYQGIDMAAHVGGLVSGFLFGLALLWLPTRHRREKSTLRQRSAGALRPWNRILAVTAAGASLVVAIAGALPRDVVEVQELFVELQVVEKKALEDYARLAAAAEEGHLAPAEVASRLEWEVLEPWRAIRERLQSLDPDHIPGQFGDWREQALEYLDTQEESWERLRQDLLQQEADRSATRQGVAEGAAERGEDDASHRQWSEP